MQSLHALLVSTGTVTLAEIGDKTQLLALLLAARYRKPWPIAWGILAATVVNHALSAWLGAELTELLRRSLKGNASPPSAPARKPAQALRWTGRPEGRRCRRDRPRRGRERRTGRANLR